MRKLVKIAYAGFCRAARMFGRPREMSLMQLKRAGLLHPGIALTCAGKTDGAGAQANAVMSALAFAQAAGFDYRHTPFASVAHTEGDPVTWTRAWEDFFNLGQGEIAVPGDSRIIPLKLFLQQPRLWNQAGTVVAAQHFHGFCNHDPDSYLSVIPSLRAKYASSGKPALPERKDVLEVAIHIRRGDVSVHAVMAERFTADDAILATLRACRVVLDQLGLPYRMVLFSEGIAADFEPFADMGCELVIGGDPFASFHRLVKADVLLMAKSSFSYAAALLSDGVMLYEPFPSAAPLSFWISRDAYGAFDEAAFSSVLQKKLCQKPSAA